MLIQKIIPKVMPNEPGRGLDKAWWWIFASLLYPIALVCDIVEFITYPIWRPLVWVWPRLVEWYVKKGWS